MRHVLIAVVALVAGLVAGAAFRDPPELQQTAEAPSPDPLVRGGNAVGPAVPQAK